MNRTETAITSTSSFNALPGAGIYLDGLDGTDIGDGGLGGDAGTLSMHVHDLLNTTNLFIYARGGYTTAATGAGGDGGTVHLWYHGLIWNFTDIISGRQTLLHGAPPPAPSAPTAPLSTTRTPASRAMPTSMGMGMWMEKTVVRLNITTMP